jgi:hypothetical protein
MRVGLDSHQQRLRLSDLRHFGRRRESFDRGREGGLGFGQAFVDWPSSIGHVEILITAADKVAIGERVLNTPCSTDPAIEPDGSGNKRVRPRVSIADVNRFGGTSR